jgi:glycosyltransferase A (GT-A) superfamily protein (DUF2064 family)
MVEGVNERRGMFAVRCADGGYAVFELVTWMPLKRGDVLQWEGRGSSRMTLTNLSQDGNAVHVYPQNWDCSQRAAIALIS